MKPVLVHLSFCDGQLETVADSSSSGNVSCYESTIHVVKIRHDFPPCGCVEINVRYCNCMIRRL